MSIASILKAASNRLDPIEKELIQLQNRIAARIGEILESKGMTQSELAAKMGKEKSYISRALRGENFTLRTLVEFQQALDTDIIGVAQGLQTEYSKLRTNVEVGKAVTIHPTPVRSQLSAQTRVSTGIRSLSPEMTGGRSTMATATASRRTIHVGVAGASQNVKTSRSSQKKK